MQRAHRRHEPDRRALAAGRSERRAQLVDGAHGPHAQGEGSGAVAHRFRSSSLRIPARLKMLGAVCSRSIPSVPGDGLRRMIQPVRSPARAAPAHPTGRAARGSCDQRPPLTRRRRTGASCRSRCHHCGRALVEQRRDPAPRVGRVDHVVDLAVGGHVQAAPALVGGGDGRLEQRARARSASSIASSSRRMPSRTAPSRPIAAELRRRPARR